MKHVSYSPTKYLVSSANKKAARKQAFLENQTCTRRITRSYAKNCAISEETKRGNKVSGFSFLSYESCSSFKLTPVETVFLFTAGGYYTRKRSEAKLFAHGLAVFLLNGAVRDITQMPV